MSTLSCVYSEKICTLRKRIKEVSLSLHEMSTHNKFISDIEGKHQSNGFVVLAQSAYLKIKKYRSLLQVFYEINL